MKTPPLLMGVALLFWGWMIDAIWIAVPLAAGLELSRVVRARFEFSQSDLDRIWNLCVVLFVGSAAVTFALNDGFDSMSEAFASPGPAQRMEMFNKGASSAIRFLQYAPVTLLPIMLAQAFAAKEHFGWSTFSLWLRRQRKVRGASLYPESKGLNVSYPYLGVVLFSACLVRDQRILFTPGLAVVLVWALWFQRPRFVRWLSWAVCLACALVLGLAAQQGMVLLQKIYRQFDAALMSRLTGGGKGYDPKGTRTRMGTIGGLNQSGKIVLRVESKGHPPSLLREASYDLFKAPMWASSRRHFERTLPDALDSSWPLVPKTNGAAVVTISTYLAGGTGLLPLPSGSVRLTELPIFLLQTNGHGAVQVEQGPGFVRFQAHYGDGPSVDAGPTPEDTVVPLEEKDAILKVAESLQLRGVEPLMAVEKIRRHFANHFQYAPWRGAEHKATSNSTALAAFLLQHRSGHCEYFASATTLLLRAAGIPARYAVGYAVQEKKGSSFVVRGRHAHAWGLAWINGRWEDIDATPANWAGIQASRAAFWEPIYDGFSRLWFEFSKWRWGPTQWKRHLIWLIIPLLGLVAARILYQKQWRRVRQPAAGDGSTASYPGLDSELYQIAERLRALGLDREPGETFARWLERVRPRQTDEVGLSQRLLQLHYRLRFDPSGLTSGERTDLRAGVAEWLARLRPEASGRLARPLSGIASTNGDSTSIEGERRGKRP
jgi:hypothetical protein